MNQLLVDKIVQAVLYEGYILYPYRPSVKNHQRWTFGGLFPRAYSEFHQTGDAWSLQAECLVVGSLSTQLEVKAQFLHLTDRKIRDDRGGNPVASMPVGSASADAVSDSRPNKTASAKADPALQTFHRDVPDGINQQSRFVPSLQADDKLYQAWQEAVERQIIVHSTGVALDNSESGSLSPVRGGEGWGEGRIGKLPSTPRSLTLGPSPQPSPPLTGEREQEHLPQISIPPTAIRLGNLLAEPICFNFGFPASRELEPIVNKGGQIVGSVVRVQQDIHGTVEISATQVSENVFKVTIRIASQTPIEDVEEFTRDDALMRSLVSTHAVLHVKDGRFISLTDPPAELKDAVESCRNMGVWPVLVGEAGETDTMLASPIILYDYPQIAPESPGELFDGTEIDEILTLRVLTLTDEEKRAVAGIDSRAEAMLKRTESLAREELMNLHGAMRHAEPFPPGDIFPAWDPMENKPKLPSIRAGGVDLKIGDRVRLRPRGGADAFDLFLAGKVATIAIIEQDYEDRIHLAVTIDDDPGADFGLDGKPGHRFYYRPDEVEPLT